MFFLMAVSQQAESNFREITQNYGDQPSFAQYCEDKTEPAIQKTVQALLRLAGTQDCKEAEEILLKKDEYVVSGEGLSDLIPLVPLLSDNSARNEPGASLTLLPYGSTVLYNLPKANSLFLSDCAALEHVYVNQKIQIPENETAWVDISGCFRLKNIDHILEGYASHLFSLRIAGLNAEAITIPENSNMLDTIAIENAPNLKRFLWSESSSLRRVSVTKTNIHSLAGLEKNKNLKELYVSSSPIRSISDLTGLVNIERLRISNGELENISVVAELPNLKHLGFRNNKIQKIPNLSNNTALESIDLMGNSIRDIGPLAVLPGIRRLSYDHIEGMVLEVKTDNIGFLEIGNAKNIKYTEDMPNLKRLVLHNPQSSALRSIERNYFYVEVHFSKFNINSMSELKHTRVPIEISFEGVPISNKILNLMPTNAESISIRGSEMPQSLNFDRFSSLSKLSLEHVGGPVGLKEVSIPKKSLKTLFITGLMVDSIDFRGFKDLTALRLVNNNMQNINANMFPDSLRSLRIDDNPVSSISNLASYVDLDFITTENLPLGTVVPITESNCPTNTGNEQLNLNCKFLARARPKYSHYCKWDERPKVRATIEKVNTALGIEKCEGSDIIVNDAPYIDLSGKNISDLSPVKFLYGLRYANLAFNKVKNVAPLMFLTQLEEVLLQDNDISSIEPLAAVYPKMRRINLSGNELTTMATLANMPNLFDLDVSNNKIINLTPLAKLTKMRILSIFDNQIKSLAPLVQLFDLEPDMFLMGGNPLGDSIPKNEENCPTIGAPKAVSDWCQIGKE